MSNQSPHPQKRQTRPGTLRESVDDSSSVGRFKLQPGIRNFFLFVFIWSIMASLIMVTGIWEFRQDRWYDTAFTTITVSLPLLAIIFTLILDN